jgi:hypothetical protein
VSGSHTIFQSGVKQARRFRKTGSPHTKLSNKIIAQEESKIYGKNQQDGRPK